MKKQLKIIASIALGWACILSSCKEDDPVSPDLAPKKPVVAITAPGAGSLITGPVNIEVATNAEDSIQSVEFFVDGDFIGRDSTRGFSLTWYAGFWADGLGHQLTAVATDLAGDTVHTPPVVVTVSADASAIGLANPGPNQIIQFPLMIELLVPPELVLSSAEFRIDGLLLAKDTTAPFGQNWNPAFWADGLTHTVTVDVMDSAGRSGKVTPATVTVSVDALGYPVPLSPADRLVIDDLQQTFRWSKAESAVSYEIEVSPLSDFTNGVEVSQSVVDTTYGTTLAEKSIYFWRIRASNAFGMQTAWHQAEFATTPTFRIVHSQAGSQRAAAVDNTIDGGYVITGYWENELRVVKLNKFGAEQWSQGFGEGYGFSIRQTTDGGYIMAGRLESSTEGRFAVLKLNSAGGQTWLRKYGRDWDEGAMSVVETNDGAYVAAGYLTELPNFYQRAWLVKTSASGDSLWARTYNRSALTHGVKIMETQDNGLLLLGAEFQLAGDTVASQLPPDLWVLRTNTDGDSLWSNVYGTGEIDYPADITSSGLGFAMLGHSAMSGTGVYDIILTRIDNAGNAEWSKTFGTPSRNDYAAAVVAPASGGYFIAGTTGFNTDNTNDVYLIRTDALGDTVWTKTFGLSSDELVMGAREAEDGGFIVVGEHKFDVLIMKTDKRGRIAGVVY